MRLLRTLAVSLLLLAGLPSPAHAVTDLLPELEPVKSDLAKYDLKRAKGGKVLLRFIGSIGNHGRGVLHVRGERSGESGRDAKMTAYQRISRSDGSTREVRIGTMVYHAAHNHFHLEGVSRYRLLDGDGKVVKAAPKVTFCLMDSQPIDERLDGFERSPRYHQCTPSPHATEAEMGISIGWSDVYDQQTPGQSFDVTDLMEREPQEYTLEMTVNPAGVLREAGSVKTASVKVTIGRGVETRR